MSHHYLKNIWVALIFVFSLSYFQIISAKTEDNLKIPAYTSHLVDSTSWLTSQEVLEINKRLEATKSEGKVQIAILIVDSIQPLPIEEYSMKVAEKWKIGKKGVDNGVLVVIAKSDKKVRIEVGYSLEGIIPDAVAKRIISEKMVPYLSSKVNKPYDALINTIDEIKKKTIGEVISDSKEPDSNLKKDGLTGIAMIDDLPTMAKTIAIILGIIGGVILFADSGGAILLGLAIPLLGGFIFAILYGFTIALVTAIGGIIIAIVLRIGVPISGVILTGGGRFGGGGASGGWDWI